MIFLILSIFGFIFIGIAIFCVLIGRKAHNEALERDLRERKEFGD